MDAARRDEATILPFVPRARRADTDPAPLGDLRFRTLLGADRWAMLPAAVRARFSKRLTGSRVVTYVGEVVECRHSRLGWLLAQALRPLGAPLPLSGDTFVPAVVSVTEDAAGGGQNWTRLYGRRTRFPQVVHSAKRFAGPTGLEEHLGLGLGVALRLDVRGEALHFVSDHYFFACRGRRLRLPHWITPGVLDVGHVDCGGGTFAFTLALTHPFAGLLVTQTAMFADAEQASPAAR